MADEGLVLLDDGPHFGLDPLQVVVAEVRPVRQLEVVVEAVLDHRADGVLRAGPQPAHRLGHDVGGRVPQHLAPGVGAVGDDRHLVALVQLRRQVDLAAVHDRDHGGLGQAGPDGRRQLAGRRALGELPLRSVGKANRDDACHRAPFPCSAGTRITEERPGPDTDVVPPRVQDHPPVQDLLARPCGGPRGGGRVLSSAAASLGGVLQFGDGGIDLVEAGPVGGCLRLELPGS